MLTMEASTTIINWAMARTARIHQRRSVAGPVSGARKQRGWRALLYSLGD